MIAIVITPIFAAIGYSIIYLLLGGGLGGAFFYRRQNAWRVTARYRTLPDQQTNNGYRFH